MARLSEIVARWFGRVELVALGADDDRRAAEAALARGDAMLARTHAKGLLAIVSGSPIGLALLADAAELAGLDDEAAEALAELSRAMPWRADPWLRLARAREAIGAPDGEVRDALERAASAPEGADAQREALVALADRDLAAGDAERASRWLDRIAPGLDGADVALRRVECALARGELARARGEAEDLAKSSPADGRAALALGRLRAADGDPAAGHALVRAFVLEAPGAEAALASYVASSRDAVLVRRVRDVVEAAGRRDEPRWQAAFALSEGRREDARRALRRAATAGDDEAASRLYELSVEERDPRALHDALDALAAAGRPIPGDALALSAALDALDRGDHGAALDGLESAGAAASGWRDELRARVARELVPARGEASWPSVLRELRRAARLLDRLDLVGALEAIAVERERPLRVAVVGEFNAGKSTFLNALLGADVAPTGVLPTTATIHWVAWAPDPFARIVVRGAADRIVSHADLKRALAELAAAGTRPDRVLVYAPIERLKRIEILDTPGFNAAAEGHAESARAALDEAHVAIWLLDAAQPLKESERAVLADATALGLPVQLLVNKADRLSLADVEAALAHVENGLAEAGLASYAPPIAFSARQALAGRLGDAEALERSGFAAVERLVMGRIVDESGALRERALRRRAATIARALEEEAARRGDEERRADEAQRGRTTALLRAAAALEVREEDAVADIAAALEGALAKLRDDVRPLAMGVAGAGDAPSEGATRWAAERAVARLTEPLIDACVVAAKVEPADAARDVVAPSLRALAAGAAAMSGAAIDARRLAMAAVQTSARALREAGECAERPPTPVLRLVARIAALREVLASTPRAPR